MLGRIFQIIGGLYISRGKIKFWVCHSWFVRALFCFERGCHTVAWVIWNLLVSNLQRSSPISCSRAESRMGAFAQIGFTVFYFKHILILFCCLLPELHCHHEDFSWDSKIMIFAQRITKIILKDFVVPNSLPDLGEIKQPAFPTTWLSCFA